jgi:ABC-type polysaccharide/polyol phosphate export permease
VLGPFWITLSMSILITALGFIYSRIFNIEIATYLPYLALGFIVWGFIATTTTEATGAFYENERIVRQIKLPTSLYLMRTTWRNVIVFLHTIILFVPISLIFGLWPKPVAFLVIPGLLLLLINQLWFGIVVAVLSTRFRDVPLLIATALQIATFATPIMWPVAALGDQKYIADINPLYHLIEIVRAPLLGHYPAVMSWVVTVLMAVFGTLAAGWLVNRAARRVVFWL